MTPTQAPVKSNQTKAVQTVKTLLESPAYAGRIREVLKEKAAPFCAALVQIANTPALRDAEPHSLIASAMTAATLDLPIQKDLGFAHIVPYKKQGVKYAQLQLGYKAYVQLGQRTGKYKGMNVSPINAEAYGGKNEIGDPIILWDKIDKSKPAVGYAFAFQLVTGFTKLVYWTREEVNAHALRYSQAYRAGYETPWKTHFDAMAMKTVIKDGLTHWGIMSVEMQKATTYDQSIQTDIDAPPVYPDNAEPNTEPRRPGRPRKAKPEESPAIDVETVPAGDDADGGEPGEPEDDVPMGDDKPAEEAKQETKPEPKQESAKEKKPEPVVNAAQFIQNKLKDLNVPEDVACNWAATKWNLSQTNTVIEMEEIAPTRVQEWAQTWSKHEKSIKVLAAA